MKCQVYVGSLLCLHIFLRQFLWSAATLVSHSRTVHSTAYEDVHLGKKLAEGIIVSYELPSKTKCAVACNRHGYCRSFNFCDPQICELNEQDIYSIQEGENQLTTDASCTYFGIKKEAIPICENNGVFMSILKSSDRGRCEIFRKRIDREWGPCETSSSSSTSATQSEWKVVKNRDVSLDAAHGGTLGSARTEKTLSWLLFVFELKTWSEARDYCANNGGRLFDALNGTSEQLQFLSSKDGHIQFYWVGISRDPNNREVWLNMNGTVIGNDKLFWHIGEPNDSNGIENCAVCHANGLLDVLDLWPFRFICDLNIEWHAV